MLRSEYQPTHRSELISAGALWAHVVAFAFLFPLAIARLPNKPSSRIDLFSSPPCPAIPSCLRAAPSPPRRVAIGASSKSYGASPWAAPEMAPSCSRSLRASPGWLVPGEERGSSRSPSGSRRPDRSNDGTGSSAQVRKGVLPSGCNPHLNR